MWKAPSRARWRKSARRKIVGHLNVPGRLAASALRALRQEPLTFLDTLIDKKEKKLAVNWDDEIVKGTLLTRDGAVVHPDFQPKRCLRRLHGHMASRSIPSSSGCRSSCWRSSSATTWCGR